jgi:hypothetical protein
MRVRHVTTSIDYRQQVINYEIIKNTISQVRGWESAQTRIDAIDQVPEATSSVHSFPNIDACKNKSLALY